MVDTEFSHYYDKESTALVVEFRGLHIATSIEIQSGLPA